MKHPKKKGTVSNLMRWLDREAARVPSDQMDSRLYYRMLTFNFAANGDESFSGPAILDLYWRVVHDKLEHADRAVLAMFLSRIANSKAGLKIVAGAEGRGGQHRRGAIGLSIAADVADLMRSKGVTAEQAWADVGERHHLTASAVKGHWMDWKPQLIEGAREVAARMFPSLSDEELDVAAKVGALGPRANLSVAESRTWQRISVKHHPMMIDGQSPSL